MRPEGTTPASSPRVLAGRNRNPRGAAHGANLPERRGLPGRMVARSFRVLPALLLASLAGCGGGSYIHLNLMRDVSHEKPIYVGVYYLSQEAAIDAASIPDLIDNPERFTDGVVAKQVLPVYPGEVKPLPLENYDPAIRWVALVADFGASAECARDKAEVPSGAKLDLQVSIEADCIRLEAK